MKVILTGSSGFLGSHVQPCLRREISNLSLVALSRRSGAELLAPDTYADALTGADAVLHLAAATGKATPAEHFRVNTEGTRVLVEQCRRSGVRRLIFVSSIASTFPDLRHYPYARAKLEAEKIVQSSGLDFTIVRPTIIAGRGSPVMAGLQRLASLPVVPVFGDGRILVQPIEVNDLAGCLVALVRDGLGRGETIELGGPEVVTIEQLLRAIRIARNGRPPRTVHLPLAPVMGALHLLEPLLYRFLPLTRGQLCTFRFPGTARTHPLFESRRATMTGLTRMIEAGLSK